MKPVKSKLNKGLLAFGAVCALVAASPASAQVISCPAGYGYSYGYGCVPVAPVYAVPPVVAAPPPPVYDAFGISFGYGGDHRHYDHHPRGWHAPPHHDDRHDDYHH